MVESLLTLTFDSGSLPAACLLVTAAHALSEELIRSRRETCDQILCVSQSRSKANYRRCEKPQLDNPVLYELTKRAGRISIVPNAERDAQDFDEIFGRPCVLLPESASVSADRAARIEPYAARSRG